MSEHEKTNERIGHPPLNRDRLGSLDGFNSNTFTFNMAEGAGIGGPSFRQRCASVLAIIMPKVLGIDSGGADADESEVWLSFGRLARMCR